MAAIIDPETLDGLGGPLGWWCRTEKTSTGWFKHIAPKSFRVPQRPRRFWEIGPEILRTYVLNVPLPSPLRMSGVSPIYFFIFSHMFRSWNLYFSGYLGLQGAHISGEKINILFVAGSAGVHWLRYATFRVLSLKNGLDIILTFVRYIAKNHGFECNYLVAMWFDFRR